MVTPAPLFDFALRLAEYDPEGYYYTRWDKAVAITVRAATRQEAVNQAAAAIGAPRRGFRWTSRVDSVTSAAVTDERTAAKS